MADTRARDRSGWALAAVIAAMALGAGLLTWWQHTPLPPDTTEPPAALAMPLPVVSADAPLRILVLTQTPGTRHFWAFSNGMRWGDPASERFRHVDLVALDEQLAPLWRRRLREYDQASGDEWRFTGVSADGASAVVAMDSPYPIAGADHDTTPHVVSVRDGGAPDSDPEDVVAPAWTTFDTRRLLARGTRGGGAWIGVLSDEEAAKLGTAEGREQGWRPDAFGVPVDGVAYGLWTARLDAEGRAMPQTLRPLAAGRTFVGAGVLVGADGVAPAAAPGTALLLAREAGGALSLLQVDVATPDDVRTTGLPQAELALAVATAGTLVLYGHAAPAGTPVADWPRYGVFSSIRLVDGRRTDRAVADLHRP